MLSVTCRLWNVILLTLIRTASETLISSGKGGPQLKRPIDPLKLLYH